MVYNCNYPEIARDAGFKLRQYRDGPLDWRLMGSYETERILREQNIEQVDNALHHLSEAPLGSVLDTNILDSGIAKYFIMSQFSIQYLLFCRKFLDETVSELRESHAAAQTELAQVRSALAESNNEIVQLQKKITQIEAIREVVYPCHLCSKSFVSNEALNIHIGRRHGHGRQGRGQRVDNSLSSQGAKEKDNDINLINTIKMELEIKQLKERLNAAERNIKDRSNHSSSRKQLPMETAKEPAKEVRNVAIQSNLIDHKEKDDASDMLESLSSEQKEKLDDLQSRVSTFEVWQAQLKLSNEQFIDEINKKLECITRTLDNTRQKSEQQTEERVASPSMEDLERVLTEKIIEIGRASAAKLEEVVYKMEMGYKDKLAALERDLKQLSIRREKPTQVAPANTEPVPEKDSMLHIKQQVEKQVERDLVVKHDDDTYSIEDLDKKMEIETQRRQAQVEAISTENQFAKIKSPKQTSSVPNFKTDDEVDNQPIKTVKPILAHSKSDTILPESTDISESLTDTNSQSTDISDDEPVETVKKFNQLLAKTKNEKLPKRLQSTPKQFTRKDARKTVNKKLEILGFDMKSKHLTNAMLKRVNNELAEQRSKMKLKYANFYATRNRIKKFVDKLCSAKLPESAETMLKYKQPMQPIETPKKHRKALERDTSEKSETEHSESESSPDFEREAFKDRLDRLLSTPFDASRPSTISSRSNLMTTSAQIHNVTPMSKPVPLPRKRVMFSTNDTKTVDESEEDS